MYGIRILFVSLALIVAGVIFPAVPAEATNTSTPGGSTGCFASLKGYGGLTGCGSHSGQAENGGPATTQTTAAKPPKKHYGHHKHRQYGHHYRPRHHQARHHRSN